MAAQRSTEVTLQQLDDELQRNEDYIEQRREQLSQLCARRSTLRAPEDL